MQIHRTASFPFFSFLTPKPMYDTIWSIFLGTIQTGGILLYDINLGATHTMILSTRGVTIPIYLVSSTMDSIKWCVVLFKAVTKPTSDPKSEFLCQLSFSCAEPTDPPLNTLYAWISPMPSSPHITHIATALVLWQSTWSRSSVINELSILVAAPPLKSSRTFPLNVTLTQTSPWLPPPPNT